jgi:hypothetical protein
VVATTFGCVFDILRTGTVFVPFVGSSALFGLVGGILDRRVFAALLANSVPAAVGLRSRRACRW